MNEFTSWSRLFLDSLESFAGRVAETLPSILGAIIIFLVGWLVAKIISGIVFRLLKVVKFDSLADRAHASAYLKKANIEISSSRIVSRFCYWILILIVIITAAETLGWSTLSHQISRLITYLPKLLTSLVMFIIGIYIASFLRDIISSTSTSLGISAGKMVSGFVFYFLFIIVSLTALNQADIDTSILSNNLLLILGAVLLAAALSYGIASKEILTNILAGYFSKDIYKVGMMVELDGTKGRIEEKTSITITLKLDSNDRMVIPFKRFITGEVKIITD